MTHPTRCYYRETVTRRIEIDNFLVFKNYFEIDFCPGINVITGGNGTGKTTLLKLLYAVRSSFDNAEYWLQCDGTGNEVEIGEEPSPGSFDFVNINEYFSGDKKAESKVWLTDASCKTNGYDDSIIAHVNGDMVRIYFDVSGLDLTEDEEEYHNAVFIPEKDILSHARGLLALNHVRKISFDRTYMDIISCAEMGETKALSSMSRRILDKLSGITGGEVLYENGEFYMQKSNNLKIPFSFEASGYRKLGLLWKLIRNGLLERGSALFWDEPENSLNPDLMSDLVDVLLELQRGGVQIFISTHSDILARYFDANKMMNDNIKFFSLFEENGQIKADTVERFDLLEPNSLTQARISLYEKEVTKGVGNG